LQIRQISVRNFRGIESLDWSPHGTLCCLVGPGDVGKSTILDAIEAVLGARWLQTSDSDFFQGDTSKPIEITATVGELPKSAMSDGRMGLQLRGWTTDGALRDEPADDDEPVVTVRLTIDSTLEPVWELITDRSEPRVLSGRDRSAFGVVRVGGEADRHLTWGQGSGLARLSSEKGAAAPLLAEAYRKAKGLVTAGALPELQQVASQVHEAARGLGAYAATAYEPGLDTQRALMSLGTLSLHDSGVPVRLSGLGTRRLVALAVQRMAIPDGAIVLIDEIEHGLEPHRIRHALKVMRDDLLPGKEGPVGQVLMTTHSSTTVVELGASDLAVARRDGGATAVRTPAAGLQPVIRRVPEAFLCRKALVCEGKTEVGILRGLRDAWTSRHDGEPVEHRGVVFVDGGGKQAPATASGLANLGFEVVLFRDSDVDLTAAEIADLSSYGVTVHEWPDPCATETRALRDLSEVSIQAILDALYEDRGFESVRDAVRSALGTKESLSRDFVGWAVSGKSDDDHRTAIATAAIKGSWFKRIDLGESLGRVIAGELATATGQPLFDVLGRLEDWSYG